MHGCANPYELGEQRYREGDRTGAIEMWRQSSDTRAIERIAHIEQECAELAAAYREEAERYEEEGRLTEAFLRYRLVLANEACATPVAEVDRNATLEGVQELKRDLETVRRDHWDNYFRHWDDYFRLFRAAQPGTDERKETGLEKLEQAAEALEALRRLDPYSPEVATEERRLLEELRRLGEEQLAKGRLASARGALQLARELDATDPEVAKGLAEIARRWAERRDEALIKHAETRIREACGHAGRECKPECAGDDQSGSWQFSTTGNAETALLACRDAREVFKSLRPTHSCIATAEDCIEDAEARLENWVRWLINEGRRQYQLKELDIALEHWQRALDIAPENSPPYREASEYRKRAERLKESLEKKLNGESAEGSSEATSGTSSRPAS